jgi:predicted DNA-binding ribbon-helix-helix protein
MPAHKNKKSRHWTKALVAMANNAPGLINRSLRIEGRRTTCRLDAVTWSALRDAAQRERISINELCSEIASAKPETLNLTVAIRSWLLGYFHRRTVRADTVHR